MKNQDQNKEVWIGVEHLEKDPHLLESIEKEFADEKSLLERDETLEVKSNRRDFLKFLGFSVSAATVAASCDIPVKKAIPYVTKPDEIVPGVASYYASSFVNGGDYCPVLVKTREGRPIKIEGNTLSSMTKGGTSARAQASVLSLYDTNRYQSPLKNAGGNWETISWDTIDKEISAALGEGSVRIVTNTIISPTAKKVLGEFLAKYPRTKVVTYDAVSSSAMLQANEACFGQKVIPNYSFDKADVIVSFGADFLGTWISPIEYARQYTDNRKIKDVKNPNMSRHIQVESTMSLTGSNADNRILVKPSEMGQAIVALYNAVASKAGGQTVGGGKCEASAALGKVADELWANRGKSLIVAGSNNTGEQTLVNAINNMLNNYGSTLSFTNASMQRQGIDRDVADLIGEMNSGSVSTLIVLGGANPAYDIPDAEAFVAALEKVQNSVSLAYAPNETSALCKYVAPTHHYLESWGDAEAKRGVYTLIQPTISPLFNTRQAEETILRWAGSTSINPGAAQVYYEYLNANWQANMFSHQSNYATFRAFWDSTLHDGVFETSDLGIVDNGFNGDVSSAASKVSKPQSGLEVSFFETVNIGDGQYADNPWLQEMPDPITRCVWDNYLSIPIEFDGDRRFNATGQFAGLNENEYYKQADKVELTIGDKGQVVSCVRQFGQKKETVSIALGYGRTVSGDCGIGIGRNVYPWMSRDAEGNVQYYNTVNGVNTNVEPDDEFACVQYHHTMGVTGKVDGSDETLNVDEVALMTLGKGFQGALTERSIIERSNLNNLEHFMHNDGTDGQRKGLEVRRHHHEHLNQQTIYPYDEFVKEKYSQGHHWGLHVDLNACTGCGACQVACVAENNVPVVGKHEVYRHHEMTWLRIDRYFYGDYENPNVVYQPMMCQHCDNAPCENVCPVSATNHSSEGLNQMAYNRCIGTRYCANNCPYKVRRFNWLDYNTADLFPVNEVPLNGEEVPFGGDNLTRMVLNPDVTVRVRGVMEKCSFCVQRIQEGKLTAKSEGRALRDGEVKSACQTACPTGAITFGDTNMKGSEIDKKFHDPLNYIVLEEINIRPSVQYTVKVVNRDDALS